MSATDAVRRLLVLVPWLLERPGAHVDEAAAAVASDRATVLDDLQLLNFCGLPGRLGGDLFEVELVGDRILLHLAPTFDRPLRPSREEALRLVLSLDHVAGVLGDELPGLDDALAAVRAAAGVPAGVRAAPEPATAHLGALRDAVTGQHLFDDTSAGDCREHGGLLLYDDGKRQLKRQVRQSRQRPIFQISRK